MISMPELQPRKDSDHAARRAFSSALICATYRWCRNKPHAIIVISSDETMMPSTNTAPRVDLRALSRGMSVADWRFFMAGPSVDGGASVRVTNDERADAFERVSSVQTVHDRRRPVRLEIIRIQNLRDEELGKSDHARNFDLADYRVAELRARPVEKLGERLDDRRLDGGGHESFRGLHAAQ